MDQWVSMKLRVDLVPKDTEVQSVSLVDTAVTRNLYDDDPTEIPIFLTYQDREPTTDIQDVQALNAGETKDRPGLIESARFADGTDWMIRTFFRVDVLDDHTLLLSTDTDNLQNQADALGSLKSSYSLAFTLRVGDRELTTEPMKLTVQQKKPVLKAKTVTLNSWYQQPKEEILFTGGTVTEIKTVDPGDLPVSWEQKTGEAPGLCLTEPIHKDLSGNVKASVLVEGCNVPVNVTVPVKILGKAPAFRLGKSSVTLNPTGYNEVIIPLTCAAKGLDLSRMKPSGAALLDSTGETPLEGYGIEISEDLTELSIRTTGQNRPVGTQNAIVRLGFSTDGMQETGERYVDLKLKLTVKEPKLKLSTSSVTFNIAPYSTEGDTPVSDKTMVMFTSDLSLGQESQGLEYQILNKAKADCTDLFAVDLWYAEKTGNIKITPDLAGIDPKDTYTLTLGVPGGKSPAKLTMKFSSAAPSATMKAQGKLDSFGSADEGLVTLTFSFKNMGSGFEYLKDTMEDGPELALYDSKGRELDGDLWGWLYVGGNYAFLYPGEGVIPAGKYKAVMTFGYWNGKPITAATTVTAVQTPTTAKLSKSSVTLHPLGSGLKLTATPSRVPIGDEAWPEARLEYYRADGKTLWEDQNLIYAELDLENSRLRVAPSGVVPEKDTTVKVKIIPEARAEKKFLWLTVKVLGRKTVNTAQKITPKVSGILDPAREVNSLVLTGGPKGFDNTNGSNGKLQVLLERSQDKGKTWQAVDLPSWCQLKDGQFSLAFFSVGEELDPSSKYRVLIDCWYSGNDTPVASGNDTLVASVTAAVKCAYGSNKFTVEDPPTLYKLDPWADLDFRLKAKDASQIIDHIRLKGNPPFEIEGSGEYWTLRYTGEDPDSLKTTTLTLEIFLKGNRGTKPNATVKVKLTVK